MLSATMNSAKLTANEFLLSPEERREAATIMQAAIQISRFTGPLPRPEELAKYERHADDTVRCSWEYLFVLG